MAAVGVVYVGAEGGDLDKIFVADLYQDHPKLSPHGISLQKILLDLIGSRRGGHVVIDRFFTEEQVAHTSAHQVGRMPLPAQRSHDLGGGSLHEKSLLPIL